MSAFPFLFLTFGTMTLFTAATAHATPKTLFDFPRHRIVSSCIATICHLFVAGFFAWAPANDAVIALYAVYFGGAILCLPMALLSVYRARKLAGVYLTLLMMCGASLGLCVVSTQVDAPVGLRVALILSCIYMTLHHVVYDLALWWYFFTLDRSMYFMDETT